MKSLIATVALLVTTVVAVPGASAVPTAVGDVTVSPAVGSSAGGDPVRLQIPGAAWASIVGGGKHTVALARDGSVYAWGRNTSGQLGTGSTTDSTSPVRVALPLPAGVGVVQVEAGADFSLALATDGSVWSWGGNARGQLGHGTTANLTSPQRIAGVADVGRIAAGDHFALALVGSGTVWSWGANDAGQLGIGTLVDRPTPSEVPNVGPFIEEIAAGARHAVVRQEWYSIATWGDNSWGQLGSDVGARSSTPVYAFGGSCCTGFQSVFAFGDSTFAINTDGELWAFGRNDLGQLGIGSVSRTAVPTQVLFSAGQVRSIDGGALHAAAVTGDGTLWTWGDNRLGQLGQGGTVTRSAVPVPVAHDQNRATVSAGARSVVVVADGFARAWGENDAGQLGDGSATTRATPAAVRQPLDLSRVLFGGSAATALTRGAAGSYTATTPARPAGAVEIVAETRTAQGAAGPRVVLPAAFTFSATPPPVFLVESVPPVAVGESYAVTLGVRGPGPVTFAVASGALPPGLTLNATSGVLSGTPTAAGTSAVTISARNAYGSTSIALTLDVRSSLSLEQKALSVGAVGRGYVERIGLPGGGGVAVTSGALPAGLSLRPTGGPAVELVGTPTASGTSTFTLTTTRPDAPRSTSYTVGVGVAPRTASPTPPSGVVGTPYSYTFTSGGATAVTTYLAAGSLPPGLTLNTATGALSGTPTASGRFDVVIGTKNAFAQEATDVVFRISAPGLSAPTNPSTGVVGGGSVATVSTPSPRFSELTTTGGTTLGLTADGYVWAWGTGSVPLLSERGADVDPTVPTRLALPLPPGVRVTHLVPGSTSLFTASDGSIRQLVVDPTTPTGTRVTAVPLTLAPGVTVRTVTAGDGFALALASDGSVWAWGANDRHQLGDGTATARATPVRVAFPAGTSLTSISAAAASALAVDTAGAVWSWGFDVTGWCEPWEECTPVLHATPVRLTAPVGLVAKRVIAGESSAMAVATDGSLWSWGGNIYGQLGHSPQGSSRVDIDMPAGVSVRDVAIASEGAVAVLSDGSVWRWGRLQCHLDLGLEWCGRFEDAGVFERPTLVAPPVDVPAVAVTACRQCGLVLTADGAVWGWGANDVGQLGDGSKTRRFEPVVARPPFAVSGVMFDTAAAKITGTPGNGSVSVVTPAHAAGKVDVVVTTRRPNGDDGPMVRYSGAFTYGAAPVITSGAPPTGTTKLAYSFPVKATGTGPLSYGVSAGALPAGLTLNATTGVISGTPTTSGASTFTIKVTNAFGAGTASYTTTVVAGVAPVITSATPPAGTTKLAYAYTVKASGTGPLTYAITAGTLPAGLTLNATTGVISGTPTTAATSSFTIRASNAWGSTTAAYTVTVTAGVAPRITSLAPPAGRVKIAYTHAVKASGTSPMTYSIAAGALPAGLTLNTSTGLISGTPTTVATSSFTIRVTSAWGTTTAAYTIKVTL